MKKFLLFLLAALLAHTAFSQEFSYEGLTYRILDGDKCELTGYETQPKGSQVIPETIVYSSKQYQVVSIGYQALRFCESLTSVEIPNSVTSIGEDAFSYCRSLKSIEIPNSVTSIGDYVFKGCASLISIIVHNENPMYSSIDGVLFNKEDKELVCYPCGKTETSYQIPNSVTSIGKYAFGDCRSLKSIEIPNSVTSIGNHAFNLCNSMPSIEIPNSVVSIGEGAFYNCHSLTSIEIPNSVASIGVYAFCICI